VGSTTSPLSPAISATTSAPSLTTSVTPEAPTGLTGTWEGQYVAKKMAVSLPPRVKDQALERDDGKKMAGKGSLSIVIDPTGKVSGKSHGALGPGRVTGHAEDELVRASINPEDPTLANAMTGVFVALQKDGALVGEIHVAGPDATVVRQASVTLKRK
jgi:hypothetical protein